MGIVERIPQALQAIFGPVSDQLAKSCEFIKRERGFSGSGFVRALVFGWLTRPRASIEYLSLTLGISGSGLQQRLTPTASEFLRHVFQQALQVAFASRPVRIPLLSRFNGVYAEDCSTISLPEALADQFPGCGGSHETAGKSALRFFTSYELTTGKLHQVETCTGRGADSKIAQEHAVDLPVGALRIRDMGFFDRNLFERDTTHGVFWISRIPANLTVREADGEAAAISDFLSRQPADVRRIDCWLWVGQKDRSAGPLWCRFMAVRCPPEVAARRRAKVRETARRKGRSASQRQLLMCEWTVLITNIREELLSLKEAWELYCSRWQIELLFKRWKSLGGLQVSTQMCPGRVLCELYAKLLGLLVSHWFALIRGGPLEGFSIVQVIHQIQDAAPRIRAALDCLKNLRAMVEEIADIIKRLRQQPRRKKRPSTRQRLFCPETLGLT